MRVDAEAADLDHTEPSIIIRVVLDAGAGSLKHSSRFTVAQALTLQSQLMVAVKRVLAAAEKNRR